MVSDDFRSLLAGRFCQGLGIAGPRIVTMAIVRDQYAGRGMAQIMSVVMAIFIIVPALAPLLGLGIMKLAGWRGRFLVSCWGSESGRSPGSGCASPKP